MLGKWQNVYAVTSLLQDKTAWSAHDNKQAQGKKSIDVYNLTNFHTEKVRSAKDLRRKKRNTEGRLNWNDEHDKKTQLDLKLETGSVRRRPFVFLSDVRVTSHQDRGRRTSSRAKGLFLWLKALLKGKKNTESFVSSFSLRLLVQALTDTENFVDIFLFVLTTWFI